MTEITSPPATSPLRRWGLLAVGAMLVLVGLVVSGAFAGSGTATFEWTDEAPSVPTPLESIANNWVYWTGIVFILLGAVLLFIGAIRAPSPPAELPASPPRAVRIYFLVFGLIAIVFSLVMWTIGSQSASFGWVAYAPLSDEQFDAMSATSNLARVIAPLCFAAGLVSVLGWWWTAVRRFGYSIFGTVFAVSGGILIAASIVAFGFDSYVISTSDPLLVWTLFGERQLALGFLAVAVALFAIGGIRARSRYAHGRGRTLSTRPAKKPSSSA